MAPSFKPVHATWTGSTIYIKADGSVEPSDAPLVTSDKTTYFLTDDVTITSGDGIVVKRNNIILEGNNHTVTGPGWGEGVSLWNRVNVTIRNISVRSFGTGIYLDSSSNNTIYHNNFVANSQQVYSYNSVNSWDDGYPSGGKRALSTPTKAVGRGGHR